MEFMNQEKNNSNNCAKKKNRYYCPQYKFYCYENGFYSKYETVPNKKKCETPRCHYTVSGELVCFDDHLLKEKEKKIKKLNIKHYRVSNDLDDYSSKCLYEANGDIVCNKFK